MTAGTFSGRYYGRPGGGGPEMGPNGKGAEAGIFKWNGGEGSRLGAECKAVEARAGRRPPSSAQPLVQSVALAKKARAGAGSSRI
jgi:hypothetical protein